MNRTRSLLWAAVVALLLPATSLAATPAAGVPQEIRSGLFADINMGGFFALGGKNRDGESAPSNLQPYLQLGIGYDVAKNFSIAGTFGLGASAASCFAEVDRNGRCMGVVDGKSTEVSDNFTLTMFAVEASYKHALNERLILQPRIHLGYASLDPEPRPAVTDGVIAGAGVGIEYATHMDHFSIGADLYGRYIIGPNIFSMAIYPKVKYTF